MPPMNVQKRKWQHSETDHHPHDPFCWDFQVIEMEKEHLLHFGLLMKGRFQFKNDGRTSALLLTTNKMAVHACDVLQMNTSDEPYRKGLFRHQAASTEHKFGTGLNKSLAIIIEMGFHKQKLYSVFDCTRQLHLY